MSNVDAEGIADLGPGDLPWEAGAMLGAIYYLKIITAIFFVFVADLALSGYQGLGSGLFYSWGWIFYNAHVVEVVDAAGVRTNVLAQLGAASALPAIVYYAVPPLLLARAGQRLAWKKGGREASEAHLALIGATIAAGYLPLAVGGKLFFTRGSVGPEMLTTVALAGLFYPVAFGAMGGSLVHVLTEE